MRAMLICLGMTLFGIFLIYEKSNKLSVMQELESKGVATEAYPTETYEKRGRRSGTSYYVKFEFQTKSGVKSGEQEIDHALFSKIGDNTILHIRYLADDPAQVMIDGQPLASSEALYAGIALLVAGLAGLGYFGYSHFQNTNPE